MGIGELTTVAPYISNKGPPKHIDEKRKKIWIDPIQLIWEGVESWS